MKNLDRTSTRVACGRSVAVMSSSWERLNNWKSSPKIPIFNSYWAQDLGIFSFEVRVRKRTKSGLGVTKKLNIFIVKVLIYFSQAQNQSNSYHLDTDYKGGGDQQKYIGAFKNTYNCDSKQSTYYKIWCLLPFHSRHIFRAAQYYRYRNCTNITTTTKTTPITRTTTMEDIDLRFVCWRRRHRRYLQRCNNSFRLEPFTLKAEFSSFCISVL